MSKSHLPTQKDGELFPQEMQQPTVTRVVGIDTRTPEGAAALAARAGEINRFVTAARQHYSLNGQQQLAVRRPIRDGEVRYRNQGGNELVEIRVELPRGGHGEQREDWWDWAVIDLQVLNSNFDLGSDSFFGVSAFLVLPELVPILTGTPDGVAGVAADDGIHDFSDGSERPVMAFPSALDAVVDLGAGDRRHSTLRVDLRPLRGTPIAVVKLYGFVEKVDITYTLIGYRIDNPYTTVEGAADFPDAEFLGTTVASGGPPSTYVPTLESLWPYPPTGDVYDFFPLAHDNVSLGDIPAPTLTPTFVAEPLAYTAITYDSTSGLLRDTYEAILQLDLANGRPVGPGETEYDAYKFWSHHTWDQHDVTTPVVTPRDLAVPCQIYAQIYKGSPNWATASRSWLHGTFATWEIDPVPPERNIGGLIGSGVVLDNNDLSGSTPHTHFGMAFIGDITIDLRKGYATFKPA